MTLFSVVATTEGLIRLSPSDTDDGVILRARGIPIASSHRRFLAASPVQPWTGIRDDDPQPPVSPQHRHAFQFHAPGAVIGNGGTCVHASVWAPRRTEKLPVLVWLHGGGGFAGSSTDRDGVLLSASLNAVVISLSFRVGVLGHLHLPELLGDEYADSGNTALSDIRAGLEWVHQNAAVFGGDPSRITLGGQSAGAALVAAVLATSWGSAIVSSAIMQSGTAERTHDPVDATAVAREFVAVLGGAVDLTHCPESDLITAQAQVLRSRLLGAVELPTPFRPVVSTATLAAEPLHALQAGHASRIPLLIGTNLRESEPMVGALDGATRSIVAQGASYAEAVAAVKDRGFDVGSNTVSWCTDRAYRQPTERILSARRDLPAPTYAYLFTGTRHVPPVHNAELDLLFGPVANTAAVRLRQLWRSFLHEGRRGGILDQFWPPYGPTREIAVLGEHSYVVPDPLGELREAWKAGPVRSRQIAATE